MPEFYKNLLLVCRSPINDASPDGSQSNSYREVISLQAILVTLIVALIAYIQKEPIFQIRVDVMFVLLAAVPMMGLYHICCGRVRSPEGDVYVYTRPVRDYSRKSFFLALLIVAAVCVMYWQGQLPGQRG